MYVNHDEVVNNWKTLSRHVANHGKRTPPANKRVHQPVSTSLFLLLPF